MRKRLLDMAEEGGVENEFLSIINEESDRLKQIDKRYFGFKQN